MSQAILTFYTIIQILFLTGLGLSVLYIFLFSVAGLFYRQRPNPQPQAWRKIAVLIPGYMEDTVIREAAGHALLQVYPKEYFDVVVIADSFQQETLDHLKTLP